ncbi:MAG: BolA family protein [Marinicella sp.]
MIAIKYQQPLYKRSILQDNALSTNKQLQFMHPNEVKRLLSTQINCEHIEVNGEDQRHYDALVVSQDFEGMMKIKRHRLIYQALGDHMIVDIHALSIKAMTPAEYKKISGK